MSNETPEEMYKRITRTTWATIEEAMDEFQADEYKLIDVMKLLNHYRKQVEVLREALRGMSNAATEIEITCERRGYSSKNALSTSEIPEHTPTLGDLRKCRKAFEATELNKWSEE